MMTVGKKSGAATKPSIKKAVGTTVSCTNVGETTFIKGGLGAVLGLRCAGVYAGFRRNPTLLDLALVVADEPCVAAAMFTQNKFCAAPVSLSKQHLAAVAEAGGASVSSASQPTSSTKSANTSGIKAIMLNSGNANAATGKPGMKTAVDSIELLAEHLACAPEQVLVASTGVIGVPLPFKAFETGVPLAVAALGASDGSEQAHESALCAARAIMTTDTHPKKAAVSFSIAQPDGSLITYKIGGMVKGSGMIEPNMATMLGVLATDAPLSYAAAQMVLHTAVNKTLNKVTVDSDSSTNDSVFFMATGASGGATIEPGSPAFAAFAEALTILCEDLARQIAYDGEGATKLVTVNVCGAATDADADKAARAVANSPLVKTAIAGRDANWGRIAMAIGKSGAEFAQEDVDIAIMGLPVCKSGLALNFDEDEALKRFEQESEIVLDINLGAGSARTTIWTCDMTHEYISINGDYRT